MGTVLTPAPTHPDDPGQYDSALDVARVATAACGAIVPGYARFDGEQPGRVGGCRICEQLHRVTRNTTI